MTENLTLKLLGLVKAHGLADVTERLLEIREVLGAEGAEAVAAEPIRALNDAAPVPAERPTVTIVRTTKAALDLARQTLEEEGHPLHAAELMARIRERHHADVKYTTLVAGLNEAVEKRRAFKRIDANVFGLRGKPAKARANGSAA